MVGVIGWGGLGVLLGIALQVVGYRLRGQSRGVMLGGGLSAAVCYLLVATLAFRDDSGLGPFVLGFLAVGLLTSATRYQQNRLAGRRPGLRR